MRNPSYGAAGGKYNGKHFFGYTECFENNSRVKVNVRVELFSDKIIVFQGDLFKLFRQSEQRVVFESENGENFVTTFAHDRGPRVVAFVNPMAKTH